MSDSEPAGDEGYLSYLRDAVLDEEILEITTEAGPERRDRAEELMTHYAFHGGEKFERGPDDGVWGEFMRSIPAVDEWRDTFYSQLAEELTPLDDDQDEERGTFSKDDVGAYIGVDTLALHEWPELKLTLGEANPGVSAEGEYVVTDERSRYTVSFENTTWTWHDRGDLRAEEVGNLPEMDTPVPDGILELLGWAWDGEEFPIEIRWEMDERETIEKETSRCGVRCKDYEEYGLCDRQTYDEVCWQHA